MNTECPDWMSLSTFNTPDPFVRLHEEIIDFYEYSKMKPQNIREHKCILKTIEELSKKVWSDCKVCFYGSSQTGLWLPGSDLDILVFTKTEESSENCVVKLAAEITESGIAEEIQRIISARVPIIKIIHKVTKTPVDISFNCTKGLEGVRFVRDYLERYPEVKYLVFVLKHFLKQKDLCETYNGGVGSFLLFCMVVSSLQHHPFYSNPENQTKYNLAHYFLHFLHLYGVKFNYSKFSISILEGGCYLRKWGCEGPTYITVECPLDPFEDLGRSSFAMDKVQKAFRKALYKISSSRCGLSLILNAI